MKFVIIPYIALGLVLSVFVGVRYNCTATFDVFPTYYGSPFVFKSTSLGSSMEYFYSISGLIMNVLIWSLLLFVIDELVQKFNTTKWVTRPYKIIVGLLIGFTTLNILFGFLTFGSGFDKNSNYWYWDMSGEAKKWGVVCDGKWSILHH